MDAALFTQYRDELSAELANIMTYWGRYTVDDANGGFLGKIDNDNHFDAQAPKGSVLNARILWSFSAAYNHSPEPAYLEMADRAYEYIVDHFIDHQLGGVYWTVDYQGKPLDKKKQVYAIAFTIYGLTEYYKAGKSETAKELAINLYHLLVNKSYDQERTGYYEAFTHDWQPIDDLRLSAKDANEKKTMNTHLHVLEAYANLYRIWPDSNLRRQIITLLHNFTDYFIDPGTHNLRLFFSEEWQSRSTLISYGHDIEAAWLLLWAAEVVDDAALVSILQKTAVNIADVTQQGLDQDGGLWYELEPQGNKLIREKHWWVQAEAMIGFFNAYQVSGSERYATRSLESWNFVKEKIIDRQNGEWFWGVDAQGTVMPNEDKAGLWKCPYHNSRACIELINRINSVL